MFNKQVFNILTVLLSNIIALIYWLCAQKFRINTLFFKEINTLIQASTQILAYLQRNNFGTMFHNIRISNKCCSLQCLGNKKVLWFLQKYLTAQQFTTLRIRNVEVQENLIWRDWNSCQNIVYIIELSRFFDLSRLVDFKKSPTSFFSRQLTGKIPEVRAFHGRESKKHY